MAKDFSTDLYTGALDKYCQENKADVNYREVSTTGPLHDLRFVFQVVIDGKEFPEAEGRSKREAKDAAAKLAMEILNQEKEELSSFSLFTTHTSDDLSIRNYTDLHNRLNLNEELPVTYQQCEWNMDGSGRCFYICIIGLDGNSKGVGSTTQKAPDLTCEQMVSEQTSMGDDPAPRGSSPEGSSDYGSNSLITYDSEPPSENGFLASGLGKNSNSDSSTNIHPFSKSDRSNSLRDLKMFMKDFSEMALIGSGGYGQVFKARDKHDGKLYAIKCVKYDSENRETVEREAEVLAKLDHPNIVHYYSSWAACYTPVESDQKRSQTGFFFIQMEFCDKGTLEQWIDDRRGKTPEKYLALELFLQIVEGVNYIHSQGFIHGDLTPSNIFLLDTNQINIGDLGFVTLCNNGKKQKIYKETSVYTSPEQLPLLEYGTAKDIIDLGVILAQLLYISHDRWETEKILEDLRNGHVPDVFDDKEKILLQKLVSKDPKKRINTFEILKTIKEWMNVLEK